MVNKFFFLFLIFPLFLFSGEFTATVNRKQVNVGEGFTLNLTLKDATAKNVPDLELLKKSFNIHSQQQMHNTHVINGQMSSSVNWKLTLIALNEGPSIIPSINIDSSDGVLSTQPINIEAIKGAAGGKNSAGPDLNDLTLTATVTNAKPYKNEPLIYKVKLIAKKSIANINMEKMNIENAIMESNGEPKAYNSVIDGVNVGIVEFEFLITPLKAGSLKIPSVAIQGVFPIQNSRGYDDRDLFAMMRGYDQLKPFALATNEIVLDVQAPVAGLDSWLPAKSLKLEELWNPSQTIQAGEPISRGFRISAEGIKSNQLPSLIDLLPKDINYKIYSDKPESIDENKDGILKSSRIEHYTIIPQNAGELTLPELSVTWWNLIKNEKAVTTIPARTLEVLPAVKSERLSELAMETNPLAITPTVQNIVVSRDPILYVVIAVLSTLLLAVIIWGITLQQKIKKLQSMTLVKKCSINYEKYAKKKQQVISSKYEKLPDLNPT